MVSGRMKIKVSSAAVDLVFWAHLSKRALIVSQMTDQNYVILIPLNRKFGRNKCEQSKNRKAETYSLGMTKHHLKNQHTLGEYINQNE